MTASNKKPFTFYTRTKKDGKKVYYVRFNLPDGSRTPGRSTGKFSQNAAEAWAYNELRKGSPVVKLNVTFDDFSKDFFDWDSQWALSKRSTGKRLSVRTCKEKVSILKNRISPYIGNLKLSAIDKATITYLRNELFRKGLTGDSINKALSCVFAVLQAAEDKSLIAAIPKIERAAKNCRERGILDTKEVKELFSISWPDKRAYIANLTAAYSGLRMGELLGLQHKSLRDGYLDIVRSWNQHSNVLNPTTKTGRSRYIPIPSKIELLLKRLIASSPWGQQPDNFIFYYTELQNRPMFGKRVLNGLKEALKAIGIKETERKDRYIDFHSWRHFLNSLLINAKIPLNKVMAITGHITEEMAKNYYHTDDLADVRQVQESLLGGDV